MKYTCNVEVFLTREQCIELWFDESKFDQWQDGFQSKEWTEGKPNERHSKSKILIKQGSRNIELEETILDNRLPDYINGEYYHIHMTNTQKISFEELTPNRTLIRSDVEYTEFRSFMPKMMAKIFPGLFKKQSQKWLDQFKELAKEK